MYLILIILFVYNGVFNYPDYHGYNRDEACIDFANMTMNGQDPYLQLTENNEPITTGIFGFVAIPFVLSTLYFGTRGGYYDSKEYKGNGTAH